MPETRSAQLTALLRCPHPAALPQAMRGLETGLDGWSLPRNWKRLTPEKLIYNLRVPNPDRMLAIKQVSRGRMKGATIAQGWLHASPAGRWRGTAA